MDVKGIGGEIFELLYEMGIYIVFYLLEYFLYCYEDYVMKDFVEVKYDECVMVEGKVYSVFLL